MKDKYTQYEELGCFLAGTFHQDIESLQFAINEFITEVTTICLENTIEDITAFLQSGLSVHEKEEFIIYNTEIYFPALNLTPIEWLEQIIELLKRALKNK
ncbi:contact-dependent growth inhibition system immunity protein [Bacillus wiedmannii]|uniref:contact-dependent growth inhibition system immunity protein n=1 Tax=Bacillus wiedmannii TaxID=1890302 RepID=UPI003CFB59E2